jgi:hypothetical protein
VPEPYNVFVFATLWRFLYLVRGASLMFAFKYEVYFASDVTATATVSLLVLRLRNFSTPALRFELWIRKKMWF